MNIHQKIPLSDLGILSLLVTEYLKGNPELSRLYSFEPKFEEARKVIEAKASFENRIVLTKALENQYEGIHLSSATKSNLELLKKNTTYTVTAAHQLCLFTGPSYFIYKILSAIRLCQKLKKAHPKQDFVPVYWMGSEDHDFEEINHANVYGKKNIWKNEGSGAVGTRSIDGLEEVIDQLSEVLGEKANNFILELKKCFLASPSYGKGFQKWILDLFGAFGLIVLDQNDAILKRAFSDAIWDELKNQSAEKALQENEIFLNLNYHVQASSRAINLFYLKDNLRERIKKEGQVYHVLNTDISFSLEEIRMELNQFPERFSPNVILRPVYQETVLPNIAFIGGPGEVAYWLQLKDVFKHHQVIQPMILLRDMAVVLSKNHLEKLDSWNYQVLDLFANYDQLAKEIVASESKNDLELNREKEKLQSLFEEIKEKAIQIDKNMDRSVDAELQKVLNSMNNLEGKLIRAEKKNFEQKLSQLANIQDKLLPNGTLQERHDNFAANYLRDPENYFSNVLKEFDALEVSLKVFEN